MSAACGGRYGSVLVGPWPGSGALPRVSLRAPLQKRRPIPRYYRPDKWGTRVLMDCRKCRTPFAPDIEIPRGRVCAECRRREEEATPPLFTRAELEEGGPR